MTLTLSFIILSDLDCGSMGRLQAKKFVYPGHTPSKHSLLWVVNVDSNISENADEIAHDLDLVNIGQFKDFDNHFIFAHKCFSSNNNTLTVRNVHSMHMKVYNDSDFEGLIVSIEKKLEKHEDVVWFSHQRILSRQKRDVSPINGPFMNFEDPLYRQQWHLVSTIYSFIYWIKLFACICLYYL